MKEGIKLFFVGLVAVIIDVIVSLAMYFIAGLALYLLLPIAFGIELPYMQSVAIVVLLRFLASFTLTNHSIKVKAVDNE